MADPPSVLADRRIADQATSLQALLEQEQEEAKALRGQLEAVDDRVRRISRAIAVLQHPTKRRDRKAEPAMQRPTQKVLDQVLALMEAAQGPVTVPQLIENMDVTSDTCSRAMRTLRAEGKVRLAGRSPQMGRPNIWALMPVAEPVP